MSLARAAGWNDIVISGLSLQTSGPNPPDLEVFRGSLYAYAFSGTGAIVEQSFANIHMGHDYKPGSKIYPHIHWSHKNASPSGDVVWKIDYSLAEGFGAGTFSAPTTVTLQQTAGAQYEHHIIEDAVGFSGGDIKPDTIILMRVYRDPTDGNDNFEDDAFILEVDFHFESDGMLTNEKVPPFTKKRF